VSPASRIKLLATGLAALGILTVLAHYARPHASPERAVYYWKTSWAPSPAFDAAIADGRINKLYMRFFDVRWSPEAGEPRPVSPLRVSGPLPAVEIIPVVYLVNEVFQHLRYEQVEALAMRVLTKVDEMAASEKVHVAQIQLDCDWSDTTRRNYFHFADLLHRRLKARHVELSSTLRLHQIKYADRTGVPPVDRGMLMFYNFGRIAAERPVSSIFNEKEAALYSPYIAAYRLPLDISLPLFSWVVHSRDGHVLSLLEKLDSAELTVENGFSADGANRYRAAASFFFHGRYFMKGDLLLLEETSPATTESAARLALEGAGWSKTYNTVALFDLDERNLDRYAHHEIQNILAKF
jgi:hypothetical protein